MAVNPIVAEILRQGRGKPRRRVAAALEIGRVESNFTNPAGGDADSQNYRQERASVYAPQWAKTGGPLNTPAITKRLFSELAQYDRGQKSYELAADVQRPAAQFRGRYKNAQAEALNLTRGLAGGSSRPTARVPQGSSAPASSTPSFDQAGYDQAVRRQKVATLLQHSGRGNSVLFKSGLLSSKPVDPAAFNASSGPDTSPLSPSSNISHLAPAGDTITKAIAAAQKRLGVHEVGANNRGPEVDRLERKFGMIGQPWCGIYLGTVLRHAGVHVDSRVASVAEIESMARAKTGGFEGGFHSAKHARAGDALITRQGQHVAFVERVDRDGTIHVIGGNQGVGDVSRGTWRPDQVFGVARPGYRRAA